MEHVQVAMTKQEFEATFLSLRHPVSLSKRPAELPHTPIYTTKVNHFCGNV
jgi:hypothetical protein